MHKGEISDYSDLTAGQYEGQMLKRESNYKWQPYWCVLYGRQLTFYEDSGKSRVAGRIEIQPGSRCDKVEKKGLPCFSELFHRDYTKRKKYSLKLKTKKGTHLFTFENLNEQTRWQIAMNNASQINASGVRQSWIPTPFSELNSPEALENKRLSLSRIPKPRQDCNANKEVKSEDIEISVAQMNRAEVKGKPKSKHDDTHTLIESDSEMTDGLAYTNPSMVSKELVTTL